MGKSIVTVTHLVKGKQKLQGCFQVLFPLCLVESYFVFVRMMSIDPCTINVRVFVVLAVIHVLHSGQIDAQMVQLTIIGCPPSWVQELTYVCRHFATSKNRACQGLDCCCRACRVGSIYRLGFCRRSLELWSMLGLPI